MSSTKKPKTFYDKGMKFINTLKWLVFIRTTGFSPFSLVLSGLALLAATVYASALLVGAALANPLRSLGLMVSAAVARFHMEQRDIEKLQEHKKTFMDIAKKIETSENTKEAHRLNKDELKTAKNDLISLAETFENDYRKKVKTLAQQFKEEVQGKYDELHKLNPSTSTQVIKFAERTYTAAGNNMNAMMTLFTSTTVANNYNPKASSLTL